MDGTFIDVVIKKLQWLLEHPEVTWSGSGIYVLELTGGAVLAVASCVFWRKKKSPPSSEEYLRQPLPTQKTDNQFNSGGEQVNVTQSVRGDGNICSGTGNVTVNQGVPLERYDQIKKDLDIGDAAFASFFKILEQGSIPREEWGAKLPEIAFRYKELLLRFETVTSDDPQVQALKEQAKQAIENGEYDRAEALLNQAKERDRAAVATLKASLAEQQAALEKRQLSEAQSCVEQAKLQRLQYRYEKSAQYFQEAAAALPEGHKNERAGYLGAAGNDLDDIARYAEALSLYEQSLSIFRDIGDRQGEAKSLNNIGLIYQAQGEYDKSLAYLEQSLPIFQNFSDTESEGVPLNNIANIYKAKGDYPKALKYFEQSLLLLREINHKEGEGVTLDNIGQIYYAKSDYPAALQYYEQALAIRRETKDKHGESATLNNISTVCYAQEKYDAALELYEQSLTISHQIGDRRGEGATLNNIGMIYEAKGDYATALKYLEQAMAIAKEINDKEGQARSRWNIGLLYEDQGELAKSAQYLSQAMKLMEHLEHPMLQECREVLEAVRAKLRERQ